MPLCPMWSLEHVGTVGRGVGCAGIPKNNVRPTRGATRPQPTSNIVVKPYYRYRIKVYNATRWHRTCQRSHAPSLPEPSAALVPLSVETHAAAACCKDPSTVATQPGRALEKAVPSARPRVERRRGRGQVVGGVGESVKTAVGEDRLMHVVCCTTVLRL